MEIITINTAVAVQIKMLPQVFDCNWNKSLQSIHNLHRITWVLRPHNGIQVSSLKIHRLTRSTCTRWPKKISHYQMIKKSY